MADRPPDAYAALRTRNWLAAAMHACAPCSPTRQHGQTAADVHTLCSCEQDSGIEPLPFASAPYGKDVAFAYTNLAKLSESAKLPVEHPHSQLARVPTF